MNGFLMFLIAIIFLALLGYLAWDGYQDLSD